MILSWLFRLAIFSSSLGGATAASSTDWSSRSIYQIVTDRYGLSNGSTIAPCNPSEGVYCGGTWQGIIKNLDYIQQLGFDAV